MIVAIGLMASIAAVGGCAPKQQEGTTTPGSGAVKGGTIKYYLGDITAIDPYNAQESEGTQVTQSLFDSLTVIEPKTGAVLPSVAETWSASPDAMVWTFKLTAGTKFADGTPVKAADFVYAWNRIAVSPITNAKDPAMIAYHLGPIVGFDEAQEKGTPMAGLKAIDDTTLEVTLSYAFADWPFVVAHPALAPVPKALVEGGVDYNGAKVPFAEMPVGNGPYKMSEPWKHDQYIKVVANGDYYGTKSNIDGIDFMIYKDQDTAYREFQAGNLDFTSIPDGQIKAAQAAYGMSADGYTVEPGKGALDGAENAIYFFSFDMKKAPFDNEKVRQAVSMAINRQAIADTIYEGTRVPADSMVPPAIPGYGKGQWPYAKYDPAAAKQMLADAGFPEGKGLASITINYNVGAGHDKVVELIQSDLKAIGITAKSEALEGAQHWDYLRTTKYDMGRDGWIADYPIADNFTYPFFFGKSGDNHSHYSNSEVDSGLEAARATIDDAARVTAYADLQSTIAQSAPTSPIVFYAHRHVGSNRLNNFLYDAQGLAHFDKAWLTDGGATK